MREQRSTWMAVTLVGVVLCSVGNGHTTSPHTISIDGVNDFAADEDVPGTSGGTWFFTWDTSNVYIGVDASGVNAGNDQTWVVLHVDVDALPAPQSGPGSVSGVLYNTQQPILPFHADFHLRWRTDGVVTNLLSWNGASWIDAGSPHVVSHNGSYLEVSLPLSALGDPTSLYAVGALVREEPFNEATFEVAPSANAEGYDPNVTHWFGWTLVSGISPDDPSHVDANLPVTLTKLSIE